MDDQLRIGVCRRCFAQPSPIVFGNIGKGHGLRDAEGAIVSKGCLKLEHLVEEKTVFRGRTCPISIRRIPLFFLDGVVRHHGNDSRSPNNASQVQFGTTLFGDIAVVLEDRLSAKGLHGRYTRDGASGHIAVRKHVVRVHALFGRVQQNPSETHAVSNEIP